jgi:hypothetical protein
LDVGVVEDAVGDQAVQADAGLVEGVVAAAPGCVGDGGELALEGCLPIGVPGRHLTEPWPRFRRLLPDRKQQTAQCPGCPWEVRGEGPQPPIAGPNSVPGGWGDDVAAAAAPVDPLQDTGAVAGAAGGQVDAPLGCQVAMAALMSR